MGKCVSCNFCGHLCLVFEFMADVIPLMLCMMRNILENSQEHLEKRFKEHQKVPSPIYDHFNTIGHNITIDNFNIVGREDQNLNRAIKESLYIRVNNPSLNRNISKYHLPHIWDEVLFNTSELKLN